MREERQRMVGSVVMVEGLILLLAEAFEIQRAPS
jgi:hypothetical protein